VLFRPFSFAPQITHLQLLYRFIAHSPRTTDQARTTPSNNSSRALRQLPSRHHSPIPSHHPFIKLPRACVCSSRIQHHLRSVPFTIRHILTRCQLQSCHHAQTPWPFERIRTHHAFNTTYHSPSVTFSLAVSFNLAITHRHHGRLSVFVPITHSTTPLTTHRPLAITHRYPHRLISKPHAYVPDESVEMQSESHPCLGVADVFCLPFADVCFALCNNCGCRPTEAQSA
jgi:hypothetical protein